jgi:putative membrane protein insertion efficiency factor
MTGGGTPMRLWAALISLPQQVLLLLVRGYRLLLKPWLGQACRFEPTCSAYTLEALQRHGASGGVLLGGWRLLRCQPWCRGGCDPVPERHPLRGLFTRLLVSEPPETADPISPNRNLP